MDAEQLAPEPDDEGQLVVVRPRVVENADHVFGNLFQRLYHGTRRAGDLDAELGAELEDSAARLEEALQLLLDYVAPFPPSLERVMATEIATSLAQRLGASVTSAAAAADLRVAVDPGRMARAFDLMATQLPEGRGVCGVAVEPGQEDVVLVVAVDAGVRTAASSIAELRWAVASKLIELHGGALGVAEGADGEGTWRVSLPRIR